MEDMHKLKNMLRRELDEFARRDSIESYDLETIHKITDTIKNIDKIEMLEDGGYSGGRYGWRYGYPTVYEDSYGDGDGYMQTGRRRDNRGRYSRDDGRDHMVNQLENMMGRVSTEQDREALRRMIDQMRGA